MTPKYKKDDEVKIVGRFLSNGDVGSLGKIIDEPTIYRLENEYCYCVSVNVDDNDDCWRVLERDLVLVKEIVEENIDSSIYCSCNGPSVITGFGTLSFAVCARCHKEKK